MSLIGVSTISKEKKSRREEDTFSDLKKEAKNESKKESEKMRGRRRLDDDYDVFCSDGSDTEGDGYEDDSGVRGETKNKTSTSTTNTSRISSRKREELNGSAGTGEKMNTKQSREKKKMAVKRKKKAEPSTPNIYCCSNGKFDSPANYFSKKFPKETFQESTQILKLFARHRSVSDGESIYMYID